MEDGAFLEGRCSMSRDAAHDAARAGVREPPRGLGLPKLVAQKVPAARES